MIFGAGLHWISQLAPKGSKSLGRRRNETIADIIHYLTGQSRNCKQVSSHRQILKVMYRCSKDTPGEGIHGVNVEPSKELVERKVREGCVCKQTMQALRSWLLSDVVHLRQINRQIGDEVQNIPIRDQIECVEDLEAFHTICAQTSDKAPLSVWKTRLEVACLELFEDDVPGSLHTTVSMPSLRLLLEAIWPQDPTYQKPGLVHLGIGSCGPQTTKFLSNVYFVRASVGVTFFGGTDCDDFEVKYGARFSRADSESEESEVRKGTSNAWRKVSAGIVDVIWSVKIS